MISILNLLRYHLPSVELTPSLASICHLIRFSRPRFSPAAASQFPGAARRTACSAESDATPVWASLPSPKSGGGTSLPVSRSGGKHPEVGTPSLPLLERKRERPTSSLSASQSSNQAIRQSGHPFAHSHSGNPTWHFYPRSVFTLLIHRRKWNLYPLHLPPHHPSPYSLLPLSLLFSPLLDRSPQPSPRTVASFPRFQSDCAAA